MTAQIGRYHIERLIGEGSTSRVYLAFDPFAQRQVALKQLRPEVLNDNKRGRIYRHLLLNEASLAGKLEHPHIAQIYDASVKDDEAYIAMEYVPGGTLDAFTRPDNLLSFERLIEIIFKATRALDYAFLKGITHRDIKPANILLVDPDGQNIKISDFGIALHARSDTTQVFGVGSPAYMSPQQISETNVDHRSDIYSLGVVMFQLLTGRLPFEGENNYSLIYRITHERMPLPSQLRPGIPPALDEIVQRAMAKELEYRYASWMEFSYDLAQIFHSRILDTHQRKTPPESETFATLRELSLFREFSDAMLWEVISFSRWSQSPTGTVLMEEGEEGSYFCILTSGEAHVKKGGKLLDTLTAGDCFGELALFSQHKLRTASVRAATQVGMITIHAHSLHWASDGCRMHFYKAFLEILSRRLMQANTRIASL